MFDKTKDSINRQKKRFHKVNNHYSKLGKHNAKEVLRSREDAHKDEYMRPSDYYAQYIKGCRKNFKSTSLWKKVAIILCFLLVALVILVGTFG